MANRPALAPDIAALLPSWELSLRAERKSPATLEAYLTGVRQYLDWCVQTDVPVALDRRQLARFTDHVLTRWSPATATARQLAVKRYAAWLTEEGELDSNPLLGVKPPKLDVKVVEPLSDDQIRALVKACAGPEMRDRRDEALVRFMVETGARGGETVALALADVDLRDGTAIVRRGKGGKGRVVPFGPQTAKAIDRYTRLRRTHRLAASPALWLGDRGKAFGHDAMAKSLAFRATLAGIGGFHVHKLRHTAAHRWLAAGGSETGLMSVAGWSRPDMLMRYTKAQAANRAAEEARGLNLGEL
jgi:site-specific recombinase XerD